MKALLFLSLSLAILRAEDPVSLPVAIAPSDPAVQYSGRFDMHAPSAPQCSWPASAITLKFSGTDLIARLKDQGKNFWQIEVDGQPTTKIALQNGEHRYALASALTLGEHTVRIVKATEGHVGVTQFLGFEANSGAKALPASPVARRLEVIGDSISCGYGVEAASQNENYSPATENAYYAYGAVAARAVGSDYTCVAFSGRKLWPDNTIPELYDRTLTFDAANPWNFSAQIPDVVVINLGTNDIWKAAPDEAGWTGAYKKFIGHIRQNYPNSEIYCATGPMLRDTPELKRKFIILDYVKKVVAAENTAGDKKVHVLDFGEQSWQNGFGANWHPSKKTQQLMADKLVKTLQTELGWK